MKSTTISSTNIGGGENLPASSQERGKGRKRRRKKDKKIDVTNNDVRLRPSYQRQPSGGLEQQQQPSMKQRHPINEKSTTTTRQQQGRHRQRHYTEDSSSSEYLSSDDDDEMERPGAVHVAGPNAFNVNAPSRYDSLVIGDDKPSSKKKFDDSDHDEYDYHNSKFFDDRTTMGSTTVMAKAVEDHEFTIDEMEKQKIQKEAQHNVEKGILRAEEIKFDNDNENETLQKAKRKRRRCWIVMLSVVLFVAGVSAAVVVVFTSKLANGSGGGDGSNPNVGTSYAGGLSNNDDGKEIDADVPTVSPTTLAPVFVLQDECDGAVPLELPSLENVQPNTPSMIIVNGTTAQARLEKNLDSCGFLTSNGHGIWYKMVGDGRTYEASTCSNTNYDTQLSIYSGSSCGRLSCVASNDQYCGNGDQSRLAFHANSGTTYYILVHGHRSASGPFQLQLASLPDNDKCENAQSLELTYRRTFGSIAGATSDDSYFKNNDDSAGGSCQARSGSPGVWFKFMVDEDDAGAYLEIELLTGATKFDGDIVVFETQAGNDGCNELSCVGSSDSGSFDMREVQPLVAYYILVRSSNIDTTVSSVSPTDFEIRVAYKACEGNSSGPASPPPSNSECETAEFLFFEGSTTVKGSTIDGGIDRVGSCGNLVFGGFAQGVWYAVASLPVLELLPDGLSELPPGGFNLTTIPNITSRRRAVTASTCNDTIPSWRTWDTQISVFKGDSCDALKCIDGNDQHNTVSQVKQIRPGPTSLGCTDDQSSVSFFIEPGEVYYLLVHGYHSRDKEGSFDLSIQDKPIFVGDSCDTTVRVVPNGNSILGYLVELSSNSQNWRDCTQTIPTDPGAGVKASPLTHGAVYRVIGTGEPFVASTCHPSTNFPSKISIYSTDGQDPCNSMSCDNNVMTMHCENGQVSVAWATVELQAYYVVIHDGLDTAEDDGSNGSSFESDDGKYFVLTIEPMTGNTACDAPVGPLTVASATATIEPFSFTFGSTRGATLVDVPDAISCLGSDLLVSRGLFYSVVGTGMALMATTCNEHTNFNSRVSVYRQSGGSSGKCNSGTSSSLANGASGLECVLGQSFITHDSAVCDPDTTVTWDSELGEFYLILVSGRSEYDFGNFGLRIVEAS